MIDVAMLDQLARPNGVVIGPHPPRLHEVFARVVADGWAPRTPAHGSELAGLEASLCRGDCISPLVVDGDLAFVDPDPTTPALPGDLVQFKLSERGAAAQNSALPPGQSPWSAGSMWLKLLARYRGIDMLLDRHGHSATATLLACEHPDHTPILHPVRNIVRRGRLLYTPDSYSAEIALNAATTVSDTTSGATLTTTVSPIAEQTVGPFPVAVTLVITMSGTFSVQNTSSSVQVDAEVAYALTTLSGSLPAGHPFFDVYSVPAATTVTQNFTYEQTFSLAANTSATYNFNASNINTTNNVITCLLMMKIEAITR